MSESDSKTSPTPMNQSIAPFTAEQQIFPMAEYDINTPPAQDSPKNMVNILNNDCLQIIFRKIDNVRDFYSAANVCTRFQQNAIECFPFGEVQIRCISYAKATAHNNQVLFFNTKKKDVKLNLFFELFGSQIKSIKCYFMSDFTSTLDLISLHCGKTLNDFGLLGYDGYAYEPRLPFQSLKTLSLEYVEFRHFDPPLKFPDLRRLSVKTTHNSNWFENQFPKLEHFDLHFNEHSLQDKLIEFKNRHTQLKCVQVHIDPFIFPFFVDIEQRLPHTYIVEVSCLMFCFGANIVNLGNLKSLKKLSIFSHCLDSVKLLFSNFVANKHQIEELHIDKVDIELGQLLQQLKTIKKLSIRFTEGNALIDMVKKLPDLEYLKMSPFEYNIYDNICTTILPMLTDIVENCNKLTELKFGKIHKIDFNFHNFYDAIVKLATGRVKITIRHNQVISREYKDNLYNDLYAILDKSNEWVHVLGPSDKDDEYFEYYVDDYDGEEEEEEEEEDDDDDE